MKHFLVIVFVFVCVSVFGQGRPPSVTTQPSSVTSCFGRVISFSCVVAPGSGTPTYQWYKTGPVGCEFCTTEVLNGFGFSGARTTTLTINTTVAGSDAPGRYFMRAQNAYGYDDSDIVTLTLLNPPSAPGVTPASSCGPASVRLTATGGSPRNYRWYTAAGVLISGEIYETYDTPVLSATTDYFVAIVNPGCEGPRTQVTATINPVPPPADVTDGSNCGPGRVTLKATNAIDGQYRWYTTQGVPISGEVNGTYVTPVLSVTTTYLVGVTINGCSSSVKPITANINPLPGTPTAFGASACGPSASVTLTATGGRGGDYRWYTSAGVLIAGQTSDTYVTPLLSTTTNYLVAIYNGTCESARATATATILTPPTAPTVTNNSSCGPAAITLTAAGAADGDFRWYTAAGVLIAGQVNRTYTTPVISSTTNYLVSLRDRSCESAKVTITAIVNTIPGTPVATGNSACGTSAVTLSASGGTNGQYRWYTASSVLISGQVNSTYTTPSISSTTNYFVAINNGTCESAKALVTAIINTPPAAPGVPGVSACGTSSVTLVASGASPGQYRWYTSAGVLINGETNNTYTTPALSATTTFYASIFNGTCESSRTSTSAVINTPPSAPVTSGASSCVPAALTVSATGGSAGQYRWYTQSSGGTAISGQTNSTYTTPVISTSTTYYVSIHNGTCEGARASVLAQINSASSSPGATGGSSCGPATITLTATGGSNGQFRWYTVASGGSPISGQQNDTFVTPVVTTTTTYYVSINNGNCESGRTAVVARIDTPPSAPTASAVTGCSGATITLTATGGSAGQYRWYTVASGGTPIAGQVNATYSTALTSTTTFYVSVNNGTCESSRTSVVATINVCNLPPVIQPENTTVIPGGSVTVNLLSLVSDPDNNLDITTLKIIAQPSSGAKASIDGSYNLILNYTGIQFTGVDRLSVEVCDLLRSCVQREFTVEVQGGLVIYNGMSPNGDGKNDLWIIQGIDVLGDTKANHVSIFNRWGDLIFDADNYDNTVHVFAGRANNGTEVPAGTYYYKIEYASGRKTDNGYFTLKR